VNSRSFRVVTLLLPLAVAACSGGSNGSGSAGAGGTPPGGSGGSTGGGTAGTTGGAGGAGTTGTGGSPAGVAGVGGSAATGSAGTTGSGGGVGGTAGVTGTTGTGGTGGTGTTASFCPSGAIFCADFEEASGPPASNPVGTATFEDPSEYGSTFGGAMPVMVLDKTLPYAGTQSLKVDPSSGFSIRTLAVAVPSTFWVRLYIKSDQAIGQTNHNSFFAAGLDPDYSKASNVELSEQFGCILLNKSDNLFPTGTTCGVNTALSANDWHCLAAEFDGTGGNVQVFSGSTQIINAAAWAPAEEAFTTFSFGYLAYNPNGATVWYDNVVVSASPLSCP
jgi:hypothetical protein